jgi:FkbM family methyltransferase
MATRANGMAVDGTALNQMSLNQIKRAIRHALPNSTFNFIQRLRLFAYKPSQEVENLRKAFETRQMRLLDPTVMALRDGLEIRLDPESKLPFSYFCWRSPEMVKELDFFISQASRFEEFVDVGANHGIFSLVFLKLNPEGRALSVDPSPLAHAIRERNCSLNGMESSLISKQVACGAAEGVVRMHFNWHHLEVSGKGDETLESVTIPVIPLDDLCAEAGISPKIVKVDVEGFELDALKGAEATLRTAKLLLLEIHPELLDKLSVHPSEIFDWLSSRMWRVRSLDGMEINRAQFCDRIHTFWTVCER